MSLLRELKRNIAVLILVLVYITIDLAFTYHDLYLFNVLPIVVLIAWLAVTRLEALYFVVIFLTPFSVSLIEYFPSSSIDFAIPTEPILFGIMLIVIYKLIREKNYDPKVFNHPVTYAIIINVFWIFVTAITSSMPLVSFKFLLARLWFLTTFYFLAIYIFRDTKNISKFIGFFSISMAIVVIYTTFRHLEYGLFDKQAAHFVMGPFFRDHTSYGAVLAMLFFALGGVILRFGTSFLIRFIYWIGFGLISLGIVLSYARAAWISVFIALIIMVITLLRIRFRYLVLVGILAGAYVVSQRTEIIFRLQQNQQDASADISKNLKSVSNISTDDSNLERLNRWDAAYRMFRERPIFGWGPGTYMFKYGPFQLAKNKTLISTDFGNRGNAHSEYIGPLAESGVLGPVTFILIVIMSLVTGFKVYRKLEDKRLKQLVLALILGLITYLVHGALNNFLDTDKASALFWGFIAVFVSLDIFYLPKEQNSIQE